MTRAFVFCMGAALLSGCALLRPKPDLDLSPANQVMLRGPDGPQAEVYFPACLKAMPFLASNYDKTEEAGCTGFKTMVEGGVRAAGIHFQEIPRKGLAKVEKRRDLADPALRAAGKAKYRVVIDHGEGLETHGGNVCGVYAWVYVYENATGRFVQKTKYKLQESIGYTGQCLNVGMAVGQELVADMLPKPPPAQ